MADQYPREVPLEEGVPSGWKAIEKMYATGKYAGKTYTRYYSLDGKHVHICSARQVIKIHAEESGEDPAAALKYYEERMQIRHQNIAAERAREAEERGRLKGERREACIKTFNDKYGQLRGSLVHAFSGWTTRWDFMPNCGQIHVTYKDPEGTEFKLLKDLEASFGMRMENGEDERIGKLLEQAALHENPDMFKEGSASAKLSQGSFESSALDGASGIQRTPSKVDDRYEDASIGVLRPKTGEPEADTVDNIRRLLEAKGLGTSIDLVYISNRGASHAVIDVLSGVYYRTPQDVNERPCYQQLWECKDKPGCLTCSPLFLSWTGPKLRRWRVGSLDPALGGYAYCEEDVPEPCLLTKTWRVVRPPQQTNEEQRERSRSRTPGGGAEKNDP